MGQPQPTEQQYYDEQGNPIQQYYDDQGNVVDPQQADPLPQWAQQYGSQLSGNIENQLRNAIDSGDYLTKDESGLMRVGGGKNQYGVKRPDYLTMQTEQGQLGEQFTETMGPSYEALRNKGMTEGDTEAAALARDQQGLMTQRARDMAQQQNQSGLNSARSNLAMRGGLRSGAAERLEGQGAQGLMRVGQDIGAQDANANLNISMQDEAMKNQLLGQTGQVEQTIGGRNVNRLAEDYQGINTQRTVNYGEDMQARGAIATGNAQQSSSCFLAGTPIELTGERIIKVEHLDLGMETELGGAVYALVKAIVPSFYSYCGVNVVGSHAVLENGKWIRVQDSELAVEVKRGATVYSPATKNHRLKIKDMVFADLHEHDDCEKHSQDELLVMLNEEESAK